jgi:MoaA/NifB/PqqE/SkfB family radical SAM enzyme
VSGNPHVVDAWLSADELGQLTEAKRRDVQQRRLAEMGIPFTVSYGGRPLVERPAVFKYRERATRRAAEPNWSALGDKRTA